LYAVRDALVQALILSLAMASLPACSNLHTGHQAARNYSNSGRRR